MLGELHSGETGIYTTLEMLTITKIYPTKSKLNAFPTLILHHFPKCPSVTPKPTDSRNKCDGGKILVERDGGHSQMQLKHLCL